jgi:molecular chaperone DnaK (HSP70)
MGKVLGIDLGTTNSAMAVFLLVSLQKDKRSQTLKTQFTLLRELWVL